MKTIAVTQARTGSSRLPKKVLRQIGGRSLLQLHLDRISRARSIQALVVASTDQPADDPLAELVRSLGYRLFRGSENDVLDRFYQAVAPEEPDYVVRLTSDCPLIDPEMIDQVVEFTIQSGADFGTNTLIEAFPDGQDVEVMKFSALQEAWEQADTTRQREHVTPYIRDHCDFNGGNRFKAVNFPSETDYNHVRMTVDRADDFELIGRLVDVLGFDADWRSYTDYLIAHPELMEINGHIVRNEGGLKHKNEENE